MMAANRLVRLTSKQGNATAAAVAFPAFLEPSKDPYKARRNLENAANSGKLSSLVQQHFARARA
jgi:hypothetical protein